MLDLMVIVEANITVKTTFVVEVVDKVMWIILGLPNITKLIRIMKVRVNISKKVPWEIMMISTIDVERKVIG